MSLSLLPPIDNVERWNKINAVPYWLSFACYAQQLLEMQQCPCSLLVMRQLVGRPWVHFRIMVRGPCSVVWLLFDLSTSTGHNYACYAIYGDAWSYLIRGIVDTCFPSLFPLVPSLFIPETDLEFQGNVLKTPATDLDLVSRQRLKDSCDRLRSSFKETS